MIHGLFISTKCMTDFTHVHLPLVSDYSRVLSAQQQLLVSIFNSSAIACKQCTSPIAWAQHASYLQIFLRHESLLAFFVNLDISCAVVVNVKIYCVYIYIRAYNKASYVYS